MDIFLCPNKKSYFANIHGSYNGIRGTINDISQSISDYLISKSPNAGDHNLLKRELNLAALLISGPAAISKFTKIPTALEGLKTFQILDNLGNAWNYASNGELAIATVGAAIKDATIAGSITYNNLINFAKAEGNSERVTNAETSIISDEMRNKILEGQRKNPKKNELIGGHSPKINNSNPNYAVEDISINADGTRKVKFTTQFSYGKLAKIKTSTLFPEVWSDNKIIESIKAIGDTPSIGVRSRDSATLHRGIIDGVQVEVIKIGNNVTSGYPTGGGVSELLAGFKHD